MVGPAAVIEYHRLFINGGIPNTHSHCQKAEQRSLRSIEDNEKE